MMNLDLSKEFSIFVTTLCPFLSVFFSIAIINTGTLSASSPNVMVEFKNSWGILEFKSNLHEKNADVIIYRKKYDVM